MLDSKAGAVRVRGLLSAMLLVLLLPASGRAELDTDSTVFTDRALGLTLPVPEGWVATTHTGYPALLLLLRPQVGNVRVILSFAKLAQRTSLEQYVSTNLRGMRALGMQVVSSKSSTLETRPIWELSATTRNGEVRQLHLLKGTRVFTLTMAGPRGELARFQGELTHLATTLRLE